MWFVKFSFKLEAHMRMYCSPAKDLFTFHKIYLISFLIDPNILALPLPHGGFICIHLNLFPMVGSIQSSSIGRMKITMLKCFRQQTLKDIKSSLGFWPGEVKMQ